MEIPVPPGPITASTLRRAIAQFHEAYFRLFRYSYEADTPVELVNFRVAAIGHGGVFASADASSPDLSPAREQLLLQTINWLLGREDRLPRADKVWQYPRVDVSPRAQTWWLWAACLGLPALFAFLGLNVVLIRRMR